MALTHEVVVRLGTEGARLEALDEVAVTHDMLQPGSPWTVTLWRTGGSDPWPQTELYRLARIFAEITVTIDGAMQLRGTLERVRVGADRGGATLTISGRDLAGNAMASDADPRLSLRNVTLDVALTRLFEPSGIRVVIGANAADARETLAGRRPGARTSHAKHGRTVHHHHVDQFRVRPGEKVWQVADGLCRRHGYLLFTAPCDDGVGLIIDRPAYDSPVLYSLARRRAPDGANQGTLLAGWQDLDATQVPTEVTVYGHAGLAAREDARHRATITNESFVGNRRVNDVYTQRPRYIRDPKARTPQVAEQRARREIAKANAGFDTFDATTQGFGQLNVLFAVNSMARIDDDDTGVRDDFLITRVAFSRSRTKGTLTQLRLVPKGSLVIVPDAEV